MNRIFKYNFGPLSHGAKTINIYNKVSYILDFQEQDGCLVMWACVGEPSSPKKVQLNVVRTGDAEPDGQYARTVQGSDNLVYHVYLMSNIAPVC